MFGKRLSSGVGSRNSLRRLAVEALERREMLSITPTDVFYKDLEFTVKGPITAMVGVSGRTVRATGTAITTGTISYPTPLNPLDPPLGQGVDLKADVTIKRPVSLPVTLEAATFTDTHGKLAADLMETSPGASGPYVGTGQINLRTMTAAFVATNMIIDGHNIKRAAWSGKIVQPTTERFDVVLSDPVRVGNDLQFSMNVPGPCHASANGQPKIGQVSFQYLNANGKVIPKAAIKDTVPIFWNSLSGDYDLGGLTPPTTAASIAVIAKVGKLSHRLVVPLTTPVATPNDAALLQLAANASTHKKESSSLQAIDQTLALYA